MPFALASAVALLGTVLVAPMAAADEHRSSNLVDNGDFGTDSADDDNAYQPWWGLENADIADGEACIDLAPGGAFGNWVNLGLEDGESYVFGFTVSGDPATEGFEARIQVDGSDPLVTDVLETFDVTPEPESFEYGFVAANNAQRVQFMGGDTATNLCISDVYVTPVAQLLGNPDFDGLGPWWTTGNLELTERDGRMCGTVPPTTNPWDVILGQDDIAIEEGSNYQIALDASAEPETRIRAVVQIDDGSFAAAWEATPLLRADGQRFEAAFESAHTANTQFMLQMGGNDGFDFCIDRASMTTGGTVEGYQPETGPRVRVNQVGYLPEGPKHATLVTDETDALDWELQDADGSLLESGTTDPRGVDPSADLNVHTIDFSSFTGSGEGFTLTADGETSYPFDISDTLYSQLRKDALGIYYSQRSGIEIDDDIKPGYGRPAGHVSSFGGDDVNQGDVDVPCLPNERFEFAGNNQRGGFDHYGDDGWDCPDGYELDLTGGWYDAGDHGKYVVNSGISVWQLLNTYERNQLAGVADRDALGDDTLAIPEAGNGMPDILDEVKWNLDWMLKMQVEDDTEMGIGGETIDAGGLAHHKLHDIAWTGMNTFPHEDAMLRFVHRPSTAATLNLAAAAAQGARLYVDYDPEYASELLDAARRAWDAANAHPDIIAPNTNDLDPNPGGGPYNDSDVSDEFYWAAVQLYLTTGEGEFEQSVLESEHHTSDWDATVAFDWQEVAAAARLDLAMVPNDLPNRDEVVEWVLEGADEYLAIQDEQPFGHPYGPDAYEWGSTHHVMNNAVVIATAYDLSGEQRYLDGAIEAIDYVLGRNAINNSYVTGYGTYFSENMHSRWYSHSITDRMPRPPDGKLAGGPNSGIQDPVAQRNLQGCAPQFCYIDDLESWSTNETTINWNASLAWHASWLDDMGDGQPDWRHRAGVAPESRDECRNGGWSTFTDPSFRNQGQCVSSVATSGPQGPPAHANAGQQGPPAHANAGGNGQGRGR